MVARWIAEDLRFIRLGGEKKKKEKKKVKKKGKKGGRGEKRRRRKINASPRGLVVLGIH